MEKNKFVNLFKNYAHRNDEKQEIAPSETTGFSITNRKSEGELAHAISMRLGITYLNSDNTTEEKIIVVRRILNQGNDLIVDALDEVVRKPRMFYASRIKRIVDIASGETHGNPKDFLMTHVVVNDMKRTSDISGNFNRIVNRIRSEVTALVFLASVDGHYMDNQKRIILDYIAERTSDIPHSIEEVMNYIDRLHPDVESFYDAIDDIAKQNSTIIQVFIENFVKLIFADGFVNENEKLALAELIQTFKEDGLDLKIAV